MTARALPRRPALDGVRGLAVLAVLLHHARVPGFAGGFLGVDVFFVLSGFLITSLLLVQARSGGVDLRAFWVARARRLLPALFAVLLAVSAYGAWLAPETTRARLWTDAVATLAYVANWSVLATGRDYFAQYADPSPLLHTWSLAVEEQFYLLWPLVVAAAVWAAARLRRRGPSPAVLGGLLLGAAIAAGAGLTWLLTRDGADVARAYHGTDTRSQQLLAGALLAVVALRRGWWRSDRLPGSGRPAVHPGGARTRVLLACAGLTGLAGLAAAVVLVRDPGAWVRAGGLLIAAALSAAIVGVAVHPTASPVQRLLGRRPLVAVGLVSYGLYLWHWPVFVVLDPERTGLTGPTLTVLRLAVTGAVATASYVWLELPLRRADLGRLDVAVRSMLVPAGAAACLAAVSLATAGAAPAPALLPVTGVAVATGAPAVGGPVAPSLPPVAAPPPGPTPGGRSPAVPPGPASSPGGAGPLRVFLLGDSTARNLHTDHPPAASAGLAVSGSTQLGCDLLGGALIVDERPQTPLEVCAGWTATWREQVAAARPDVAVLVPGNGMLFDRDLEGRRVRFGTTEYEQVLDGFLDRTLAGLARSADRVAVTTMPCFGKRDNGLDGTADVVNDEGRQRAFDAALRRLLARHPGVELLDLRAFTCPDGVYRSELAGIRLHDDGVHWSPQGSRLVWGWLAEQLRGRP